MYTARLETNDDPNVFTLSLSESFGREDLEGINGVPPLAPLRPSAYVTSESGVSKLLGREAKLFLNQPNAEYLSYLKENKDKLNVDSLVAIEFLPHGERIKKYRRLRYTDQSEKKRNAFTVAVAIPVLDKERFVADYGSLPERITQADFQGKALVGPSPTSLTFRYVFHERANETITPLNELIATRKLEYVALLKEFNTLFPKVPAGTDFSVLLDEISSPVVKKLPTFTASGLTTDQSFSIGIGYQLPGKTMNSSRNKIQVVE
jgi:hypothetical protein